MQPHNPLLQLGAYIRCLKSPNMGSASRRSDCRSISAMNATQVPDRTSRYKHTRIPVVPHSTDWSCSSIQSPKRTLVQMIGATRSEDHRRPKNSAAHDRDRLLCCPSHPSPTGLGSGSALLTHARSRDRRLSKNSRAK